MTDNHQRPTPTQRRAAVIVVLFFGSLSVTAAIVIAVALWSDSSLASRGEFGAGHGGRGGDATIHGSGFAIGGRGGDGR